MVTKKQLQEAVKYAFREKKYERRLIFMTLSEIILYQSIVEEYNMNAGERLDLKFFMLNRGENYYYPSKEDVKVHLRKNEKGIIERVFK